jgi:cytoskeleton protein RodZ
MQADARSDADNTIDTAQSGPTLRAAREQQQLSVDDVAHSLHLSRELILALEAGDFEALGPPVFVRGYLRNYARLLGLPQHGVLAGFPAADVEPEEFRTMSLKTELKPGVNLYGWLLWSSIGLILLIAAIVLLIVMQDSTVERAAVGNSVVATEGAADQKVVSVIANSPVAGDVAASNEAELQSAVDPAIPASDSNDEAGAATDASADPQAALAANAEPPPASLPDNSAADAASESTVAPAAPIPVVPVEVASAATPAEGTVALTLTFSDECWVEIADSRRSLLYGLEKAGAVVNLNGVPPFKLFLGNRQAVQIALAGKPYTIPAGAPDAGNTARFTIEEVQLQ